MRTTNYKPKDYETIFYDFLLDALYGADTCLIGCDEIELQIIGKDDFDAVVLAEPCACLYEVGDITIYDIITKGCVSIHRSLEGDEIDFYS